MNNSFLIQKYRQYLLLEKGLSSNSISAYMTDLRKLLNYATDNELAIKDITTSNLEELFAIYRKYNSTHSTRRSGKSCDSTYVGTRVC